MKRLDDEIDPQNLSETDRFWQDELFFETQDELLRQQELRHHPDSGKQIPIVDALALNIIASAEVIPDVVKGLQKATLICFSNPSKLNQN